jgi:hypothetical protein
MVKVRVIVFNATFNNISVISRRSVLLVEETGGHRAKRRSVWSHWQTLPHDVHIFSCHSFETNLNSCSSVKTQIWNFKAWALQTGSATTESENPWLLHTYLATSAEPSSVSTSSVRDRKDKYVFCPQSTHRKCFIMNCLLRNGHRSPCIPVHRKLTVVYRTLR